MLPAAFLSLTLLGISGLLLDAHRRKWRAVSADANLSAANRRYAQSEYRRRTRASAGIGVVGLMIAIGPIIPQHPIWFTIYVALLLLTTITILLLALLDIWASSQRFHSLRTAEQILQARMAKEQQQHSANQSGQKPSTNKTRES
jgi:peptidoglycan/LPS O-acetylase OafA/YrhL